MAILEESITSKITVSVVTLHGQRIITIIRVGKSGFFPPCEPADQQYQAGKGKNTSQSLKRVERDVLWPGGRDTSGFWCPAACFLADASRFRRY